MVVCQTLANGKARTFFFDCAFLSTGLDGRVLAEVSVTVKNVGDVRQVVHGFDVSIAALSEECLELCWPTGLSALIGCFAIP